jgi:hypothetical protein
VKKRDKRGRQGRLKKKQTPGIITEAGLKVEGGGLEYTWPAEGSCGGCENNKCPKPKVQN